MSFEIILNLLTELLSLRFFHLFLLKLHQFLSINFVLIKVFEVLFLPILPLFLLFLSLFGVHCDLIHLLVVLLLFGLSSLPSEAVLFLLNVPIMIHTCHASNLLIENSQLFLLLEPFCIFFKCLSFLNVETLSLFDFLLLLPD